MLVLVLICLTALSDQFAKVWAMHAIPPGGAMIVWPGFLSLTRVSNTGAAFGILPLWTWFFISITIAVLIGAASQYRRINEQPLLMRIGIGLALGGALGNLIDRLRFGRVCDFINLRYWPVFNLADTAITIGAGLILLALLCYRHEQAES